MPTVIYLSFDEALYLHELLIGRFGGSTGLRDPGLLASALARPRSGYYDTLSAQAAALFQSLATSHVFVDGNKRMAFGATAVFLRLNGYTLKWDTLAAERFVIERVIVGHADIDEITAALESHMVPLGPD